MSLSSRLDLWLNESPVLPEDLSVFRIIYSTFSLLTMVRVDYAAFLPVVAFDPPPGPFSLLSSPPPVMMIWLIQTALAVSLVMLGLGWRARKSAVAAGLLQIVLYGIGYSFGKIDHTIFLPVVALLLAFSPWAAKYSVDSCVSSRSVSGYPWVPRCLAVALGVGMLTAGLPKLRGGWLSLDSQAAFGYLVLEKDVFNAPLQSIANLSSLHAPIMWEVLDYATVFLECGAIMMVLNWRTLYPLIASLATFHFFIALTMGIVFPYNLPIYAAFVPWSRLGARVAVLDRIAEALATSGLRRWLACAALVSVSLLLAWFRAGWFVPTLSMLVLAFGAILGLCYLAMCVWRSARGAVRLVGRVE